MDQQNSIIDIEVEPSKPQWDIIVSTQQINLFLAGQGGGKCLGKGTGIRMYDGSVKLVENVKTNDLLMGPDSLPRKVLTVCTGVEQMYWIRQNRAKDYRCNESHILALRQSRTEKGKNKVATISVSDYLLKSKKYKESMMGFRVPVEYTYSNIDLDPYFLGLWLGDGSNEKPAITAIEPEIINYIHQTANRYGMRVSVNARSETSKTHSISNGQSGGRKNELLSLLMYYNLLYNKHIPVNYLINSSFVRLQVLAGLVDTDGYYDKKKQVIEIVQKNKQLANDIHQLALSLGFRASINNKTATLKRPNKEEYRCEVYRVCMYGDLSIIPCKVERKKPHGGSKRIDHRNTGIRVEKDVIDTYYGFTLEGDGLFLLEDYTVTHNTHCAGLLSGRLINQFPKVHGFIGANTYSQLSDSTLYRIRRVWKEIFNWTEWSRENPRGSYVVDTQPPSHFNTEDHDYDTYRGKICFKWGTVIYKGGLENYKAHDGKEFCWAILDETKDTKEEAVKEVIIGRLREHGMYVDKRGQLVDSSTNEMGEENRPFNPLYIFTSPAKVQWINEWFNLDDHIKEITEKIYSETTYFKKDIDNKRVTISSAFHNKKFLPSNFLENQMKNLNPGQQDMLIYGNPFSNTGGEFYKCFVRTKNVIDVRKVEWYEEDSKGNKTYRSFKYDGKRPYCPDIPLHISFDFNVNPHMTCTIYQVAGKKVYQIDEICLANPLNTTEATCKEFTRRYQGHAAGLFIYGDPAGKHEDTRTEKGTNDYWIIRSALAQFKPGQRVSDAAPPVVTRGNFINTIFEKGYEGIELYIHEACMKTISDLVYLKEASDGTKLKEKVENPDTHVRYEKYGHCSDSLDYFICMCFGGEFIRYQKGGTPSGKPSTGRKAINKNSY